MVIDTKAGVGSVCHEGFATSRRAKTRCWRGNLIFSKEQSGRLERKTSDTCFLRYDHVVIVARSSVRS